MYYTNIKDLLYKKKAAVTIKIIEAGQITEKVAELCVEANLHIATDIKKALCGAEQSETDELGREVLSKLIINSEIAQKNQTPICQDTGMTVVFVEIGQEVYIKGGGLARAIHKGVAEGYVGGFLRKSVVKDPINRINTNDNTPAVIHFNITEGDLLKITVAPKGFGSENMSAIKMLTPSDGIDGVVDFIVETVKNAGPNPCPPIIAGIGIGGTMEKAALMAKQALLRTIGSKHCDTYWANIEEMLLNRINSLGIGAAGFGGKTTCLAAHINTYATHIAGLPVAINIGCHATRHAEIIL